MEVNVIVVPEREKFLGYILQENKIWINKDLGRPQLESRNAKYIAPYWLDNVAYRGVTRVFHILKMEDIDDSYEITLGNSFPLKTIWKGLEDSQLRRFEYTPLSTFDLQEINDGILIPTYIEIPKIERTNLIAVGKPEELLLEEKSVRTRGVSERFMNEFWLGSHINLNKYWEAYYAGGGYIEKFHAMKCHIIEITFKNTPKNSPLFNMEPIYKTLKAHYHNIKKTTLSFSEYNSSGPLFLYDISRGSEKWSWLGELPYLLLFGTTLTAEQIKGQALDNWQKKMDFYRTNFGETNVRKELFEAYMSAETPEELNDAIKNIVQENIESIRISRKPVSNGNIEEAKKDMVEIKKLEE